MPKDHEIRHAARVKDQLGMSYGVAANILRKSILFDLVRSCGREACYRCGLPIENCEELSIEHKDPWLYSPKAADLFFDLENIAFSHYKCNHADRRCAARCNSRHGYKGVSLKRPNAGKPWAAAISTGSKVGSRMNHLGYFATAEEAACAYDAADIEKYGERAVTNKQLGLLRVRE